jgi:hypothetical protein
LKRMKAREVAAALRHMTPPAEPKSQKQKVRSKSPLLAVHSLLARAEVRHERSAAKNKANFEQQHSFRPAVNPRANKDTKRTRKVRTTLPTPRDLSPTPSARSYIPRPVPK